MSLAESILACDDRRLEEIDIPEWGCKLHVGVWSGDELAAWQRYCVATKGDDFDSQHAHAFMIVLGVKDENGAPVFTDDYYKVVLDLSSDIESWEQIAKLVKKSQLVLRRIAERILKLNKLTKEALEETEKNLPPVPTSDSG